MIEIILSILLGIAIIIIVLLLYFISTLKKSYLDDMKKIMKELEELQTILKEINDI